MRALYLYAVDGDQSALLDRYPLIQRTLKPGDRVADRIFLIKPGCIVCLMDESKPYSRHNITLNETLRGRWLRWHNIGYGIRDDNPPAPGDVPLGTYGGYELYVDGHHPGRFAEFALAVLAAATQSEPSGDDNKGKSGGSSGGKGAGKTAPTFSIQSAPSITIPVQ
jgi:hypothetical protein